MDWQQLVSLSIVAAAGVMLLWRKLRRPKFSFQQGSPCGCGSVSSQSPQNSIVFHARKGQRPRVLVKMR